MLMKMKNRKGVSKTIWIIIVIVIASIAALLLVNGFENSWSTVTESVSSVITNSTGAIGDIFPNIGGMDTPESSLSGSLIEFAMGSI